MLERERGTEEEEDIVTLPAAAVSVLGGLGIDDEFKEVVEEEVAAGSSNSSLTCTRDEEESTPPLALAAPAAVATVLPLPPVVVRSLGLFWEVGVSQELESELTELVEVACCVLNLRRLARSPSCGDLRPMSESMGRSLGGLRGVAGASEDGAEAAEAEGEEAERFSGEKEVRGRVSPGCGGRAREEEESGGGHRSDVLGVVSTGVTSMSSGPASPFRAEEWDLPPGPLGDTERPDLEPDEEDAGGGMAGKPRGEKSMPESPADSGMNLGVVSISSEEEERGETGGRRPEEDEDDEPFAALLPAGGGDPEEEAPEFVPVLPVPAAAAAAAAAALAAADPPRSSPVILAEAAVSMDSMDRRRGERSRWRRRLTSYASPVACCCCCCCCR